MEPIDTAKENQAKTQQTDDVLQQPETENQPESQQPDEENRPDGQQAPAENLSEEERQKEATRVRAPEFMQDYDPRDDAGTETVADWRRRQKKKSRIPGIIRELIIYALIIVLCIKVVPNYVLQRTEVDGTSMTNTLQNEENLLVEKCVWRMSGLKRFDIITFYPKGKNYTDDSGKVPYYIKRIIGLPGEKVQVVGDTVYINDKVLDDSKYKEEYNLSDGYGDEGIAEEPITLADDEYFVMGDHRGISEDSRSEFVGPVKKKNIDGRVFLRIYPFSKFGTVD